MTPQPASLKEMLAESLKTHREVAVHLRKDNARWACNKDGEKYPCETARLAKAMLGTVEALDILSTPNYRGEHVNLSDLCLTCEAERALTRAAQDLSEGR